MDYKYVLHDYVPVRIIPNEDGEYGRVTPMQIPHFGRTRTLCRDMFKNKFAATLALAERKYTAAHGTPPEYQTKSYDKFKSGDTAYVIIDDDIVLAHVESTDGVTCQVSLRTLFVQNLWCRTIYDDKDSAILAARDEIHKLFSHYVADMNDANEIYDFVVKHITGRPNTDSVALMALHYALMRLEAGEEL